MQLLYLVDANKTLLTFFAAFTTYGLLANKDLLSIQYRDSGFQTVVSFKQQYAFFDRNGIIINPADVLFEGAWGYNRMAEMLPVDYVAEEK